jgi:putative transposase
LTDTVREAHADWFGRYGARQVNAALDLGLGFLGGHNTVALLMQRAGLRGITGA